MQCYVQPKTTTYCTKTLLSNNSIIHGADPQLRMPDNRKDIKTNEKPSFLPEKGPSSEDKITLNKEQYEAVTYNISGKTGEAGSGFAALRGLVVNLLKQQGITTQLATGDMTTINLNDISSDQAQELISADGYWGVEQTSDRIVNFATSSLAGDDPEKLEEIKANITKGFELASNALGGTLPDISQQTYDAIMEKLDSWAEDF